MLNNKLLFMHKLLNIHHDDDKKNVSSDEAE